MLNRTNTQLSRLQVGGKGSTSNSTNIYQNNSRNSHFITGNDHEIPEISILNQDGSINEGMIIQNGVTRNTETTDKHTQMINGNSGKEAQ